MLGADDPGDGDAAAAGRSVRVRRGRYSRATASRDGRRFLLIVSLAGGGLLLSGAPALALSQRGHTFCERCSFGSLGHGDGELSNPAGVAVDEATDDVYVLDRGNNRIEQFNEHGEFLAAWGWGVSDGEKKYEVCTGECRAGIAGPGKGQLDSPEAIAVDNSTSGEDPSKGDIYVVTDARAKGGHLEKFSANGEALGLLKQEGVEAKWEGELEGVTVDSSGTVRVYRAATPAEARVEVFSDAVKNEYEPEPSLEASLTSSTLEARGEAAGTFCPKPGFAVNATGEDLYIDHELLNPEEGCPEAIRQIQEEENKKIPPTEETRPTVTAKLEFNATEELLEGLVGALDPENTTAVAVDLESSAFSPLGEAAKGDVYLASGSTITAFDSSGQLIQRIELPGATPHVNGIAVNSNTGDLYVTDATTGVVDVFEPEFEPEREGRPAVDDLSAENLTPTSTRLDAQINPDGGDTHYYFQYGTVNCMDSPASCTDQPAPPGTNIGDGFSDEPANVELHGLQPSTTYYYRVIAKNARGEAEGTETFASITTLPTSVGVLADNRAWEMVSPPEKDGSAIEPIRLEGGAIEASEDGNAITYVANGPVGANPEGNQSAEPTQVLSTRGSKEWVSQDLETPHARGEGFQTGAGGEYRFFSPDLSLTVLQTLPFNGGRLQQPPLSPPVIRGETQEKTIYVRDDESREPDETEKQLYDEAKRNGEIEHPPGYLPLVTAVDDIAKSPFGEELEFFDATPDLSDVLLSSEVALTSAPGLYEWQSGRPESERLQLVSARPEGAPASEPALGQENANVRDAVSADGSRIFWTNGPSEERRVINKKGEPESVPVGEHLYMRDMTNGETIQIDTAVAGVPKPIPGEETEVGYQTASSDGSNVFFTDTARLTPESNQEPVLGTGAKPPDLYECEVIETEDNLACNLKDLTPDHHENEKSADVLNVIPGASENGSYVYFVANGVLAPGLNRAIANARPNRRLTKEHATSTSHTTGRSRSSQRCPAKTQAIGEAT